MWKNVVCAVGRRHRISSSGVDANFVCAWQGKSRTYLVGDNEKFEGERGVLQEMRKLYGYDIEEFATLESSEKPIASGDGQWPQTVKREGHELS